MPRMEVGRAWRYSRYDVYNTACTRLVGDIQTPKTMWTFTSPDGKAVAAVAADANLDEKTEVVVSGHTNLYLLRGASGKLIWQKPLTCHGRIAETSQNAAVFDINMDGRPEIILPAGNAGATVVSGEDGMMVWQHPTYGTGGLGFGELADNERDVFQTDLWEKNTIYRLRGRDGIRIWETAVPGAVYDSPVAADVNGDGMPEIVFHCHSGNGSMTEQCVCLNGNGEILWIREIGAGSGNDASGAPVVVSDFLGRGYGQILVLTDILLTLFDGMGEIIWQVPTGVLGVGQRTVHRQDGEVDTSMPTSQNAPSRLLQGAAVGDIDGDGKLEIVIGLWPDYDEECEENVSSDQWKSCRRTNSAGPRNALVAFRGDTGEMMWRYDSPLPCVDGGGMSAPIIADIDGDGILEVAACSSDGHIHILKGADGSVLWQHPIGVTDVGRLIFADINDDNHGELVAVSGDTVTAVGRA